MKNNEKKPNNPIAFSRTSFNNKGGITTFDSEFGGMTLRDYFANSAMQGFISNQCLSDYLRGNTILPDPKIVAHYSYEMADAMLKEREL